MKVLSVTSECVPLVKTGGLADVAGALPGALKAEGIAVRTLIPGYRTVMEKIGKSKAVFEIANCFGGPATVLSTKHAGLDLLVLEAPHLFDREHGIYLNGTGQDWPDNIERFAALSRVAADIASGAIRDWRPDIVHCHDWQAGLTPYYINLDDTKVRSVMTVHNIAFQGIAPAQKRGELGIASKDFTPNGVEYFGNISTLKAGLVYADKITTVSPTYAQELMTPEFGMGMDGILRQRQGDLAGILNGIDESVWSPDADKYISTYKTPRGKAANKKALRAEFDLPESDGPLCIVISRLTEQKGLDLLLEALPTLLSRGGQLALLGSGDPALENAYKSLNDPNVAVRIRYDEPLSHRMIAGADAILVPSRFEPCGLTQLYGLRYGTLPVVALTGGLADTVIPSTPAALAVGVSTGIQFHPVSSHALGNALSRLCDLFDKPKLWAKLQRNAMKQPVGWDMSAEVYTALYNDLLSTT